MREKLAVRIIDGHAVTIPIRLWAGVILISAKDFTPKAKRKGNYYVPVSRKSSTGVVYNSVMEVDRLNYKVQAGRVSQVPVFRG